MHTFAVRLLFGGGLEPPLAEVLIVVFLAGHYG